MRDLVMKHIREVIALDGYDFMEEYDEMVGFRAPRCDAELEALSDEHLLELLIAISSTF